MLNQTINTKNFNNFEIIQTLKQQLLIKAPCLYNQPERARILEMILCKRDSVESAKASTDLASVSIHYNPSKLSLDQLFTLLENILENIRNTLNHTMGQVKSSLVNSTLPELASSYLINGLKCELCAMSLEMAINKHPSIIKAHVDFKSTVLKVKGKLSEQEIIKLIRGIGFEPVPHAS